MSARVFNPLFMLLARLTNPELARAVQFLKAENEILRSKLPKRPQVTPWERSRLLKLGLPLGQAIKQLITIVTYRTFRRWASDGKKGKRRGPYKVGRPRTPQEVRELVLPALRLARENDWGYTRILGELKKLGMKKICRNTVKNILVENGFDPGPQRGEGTWDEFLKIHFKTLWACDFLTKEVWTLFGKVTYWVLFFVEVRTRRVHIAGMTPYPDGPWMAQMARNIRMWWEERGVRPSYIIKDADTRFTAQFDGILESIGATAKKISRRSPNLNPYAEAWVSTIKRECLDRFIVFGENHLRHIIEQYAAYYNAVRLHQGVGNVPIGVGRCPPPESVRDRDGIVCESRLGGLLKHYCRRAA